MKGIIGFACAGIGHQHDVPGIEIVPGIGFDRALDTGESIFYEIGIRGGCGIECLYLAEKPLRFPTLL